MKALVVLIASLLVVASSPAQDGPSLRVEREFFLFGGESHSLRYSPDGRWLASGGERGDVVLLDAETGAVRHVLEASDHWVGGLRFSPDGETLAATGRALTLWRVRDAELLGRHDAGCPQALDWSRDGRRLAIVRDNGAALVLDAGDLDVERELSLPDETAADAVAFDPTGERVAVGKRSGNTYVFDVASGELCETIAMSDWVQGLAWLDDGRLLRLGWKGALRGWGDGVVSVGASAYSFDAQRDGSRLCVRTSNNVRCFARTGAPQLLAGSGPVALHPDGVRWARVLKGQVQVFRDAELIRTLQGPHRLQPGAAVLTGDGRKVVARGNPYGGHKTSVFDVATGQAIGERGLPEVGLLLANRQAVEVALLLGSGRQGDGVGEPRLEFWQIGEPSHLVRSIALGSKARVDWFWPGDAQLSGDGRFLGLGSELHDLVDPTRSQHIDESQMDQVVSAGGGEFVLARDSLFSDIGMPGVGELMVYDRSGQQLAKRLYDIGAPFDVAVAPAGERALVCGEAGVELVEVPSLARVSAPSWRWHEARWIDDRLLLGIDCESLSLQVGDIVTGEVLAELELSGWGQCTDFDAARGLAVVTLQDRVQLVRVVLPPRAPAPPRPRVGAALQQPGGYLVVKLDLDPSRDTDRGFLAAAAAAQQRHDAATFDWDGADYDALAAELRRWQPENVLFVLRPVHLDVVRHRRILLLTSKLDDDWFVDCAFGYLTGADGDACERFWQRIEQRRARTEENRDDASRNWAELSVASMDKSIVYRGALPVMAKAAGFEGDCYYFGTTDPDRERLVAQALAATDTADVLHFSGNGDPEGIWLFPDQRNVERDKHWLYDPARVGEDPDGAMPRLLAQRFAERTWRAPIVWSGTCHSGAVDRVFVEGDIVSTFGRTERVTVHRLPADHSLALAWLDAGAAALLVPIAANHGMSASMEIDFALQHGASLGEAVKSSWDDVLLQAEGELVLDLPVEGEAQRRGGEHVMQGGGANRVLLGDPALRPFALTKHPMESVHVEPRDGGRGGVVTVRWTGGWHWRAWDMYGTDSGRDWRVLARVDAASLGLEGVTDTAALDVQVSAIGDDGAAMPYTLQRCAIERHLGKVWLHLQANAPRGATERKAATVRFLVTVR